MLKLTLLGGGLVGPVTQAKFKIPDEMKKGTGSALFGFLADSVATFLATGCPAPALATDQALALATAPRHGSHPRGASRVAQCPGTARAARSATECGGNPNGELGFTCSFPTEQTAVDSGTLITWSKDFAASDVVGHDVVTLLQQQLSERGIGLVVRALANDTVGTMAAAAYRFPDTAMGVILGEL